MSTPSFLVMAGDGINCERETAHALRLAGADATIAHVNDILAAPTVLDRHDGLALPGGFSFGDELGSGRLLALKLKHQLAEALDRLVARKCPIIGICNGFQVLLQLGLLPTPREAQLATLTRNEGGHFIDRWVGLAVEPNTACHWTRALDTARTIELPIRHGEGRVVFAVDRAEMIATSLADAGQVVLRYTQPVNGSHGDIAGLCDPSGLIFGLMPHPEAYVSQATYRTVRADPFAPGDGAGIFHSIMRIFDHQPGR